MKTLFITLIALMSITAEASIVCRTPRSNKVFEIKDAKITFYNEFDVSANRELASVSSLSKANSKGLTKIVNFENQKHIIHIENTENFTDTDDYIIIKAKSGHEVTYPLTCENK